MQRSTFADMACSVAQCLEIVGEWWTLLIVRDAFMGVRRFDDFQTRLGVSRNVLNQRLVRLVEQGVFEKVPYSDHPPRFEYRLTDKGKDLWGVITTMRQWGDRWAAPAGPPIELVHKDCGRAGGIDLTCSECGETVGYRDMRATPGPGYRDGLIPERRAADQRA
ncbi:MAG TPA: helix-turn-helix domain-containing protein [Acidimicrobiales bacterium]|nr:helix-turn-helix domain-containing protein [Acidimicrobiales bacterium]